MATSLQSEGGASAARCLGALFWGTTSAGAMSAFVAPAICSCRSAVNRAEPDCFGSSVLPMLSPQRSGATQQHPLELEKTKGAEHPNQLHEICALQLCSLRVAEQYLAAFGNIAKHGNTILLPAGANDPASMVAQVP